LTVEPTDVYDEIVDRNVKRIQTRQQKRDIINDIAREFESNRMHLPRISAEIKRRMREYYDNLEISDRWIEECLDEKYKRAKRTTSEISPKTNEEKKRLLVSPTASGQSNVEPQPQQSNPNTQTPSTLTEKEYAEIEKYGITNEERLEAINEQLESEIKDRDSRLKNLEQQLKTISDRKPEREKEIGKAIADLKIGIDYDPSKLQASDNKVFSNTIVCDLRIANWIADTLRNKIINNPKTYFLIQQDFTNPGAVRINYLKTEFLT
jgi:hypothetical protein